MTTIEKRLERLASLLEACGYNNIADRLGVRRWWLSDGRARYRLAEFGDEESDITTHMSVTAMEDFLYNVERLLYRIFQIDGGGVV